MLQKCLAAPALASAFALTLLAQLNLAQRDEACESEKMARPGRSGGRTFHRGTLAGLCRVGWR